MKEINTILKNKIKESGIGSDSLWIPVKKFNDMYKPDYINFNLVIDSNNEDEYLHYCWVECYMESSSTNFSLETLILGLGNTIYAFNDETTWVKFDPTFAGWEEIPCNSLAYELLIMERFFIIHEESQIEAIKNTSEATLITDEIEKEKFKELAMLLVGCTNLEISNKVLTLNGLKQFVSNKIGYTFLHF